MPCQTSMADQDDQLFAECDKLDAEITTLLTDHKQIQSEAAALAIAEKTLCFTASFFSFNATKVYSPCCHLTLTGDLDNVCCDPTEKTSFEGLWPKAMLLAPRVVINVHVHDDKPMSWRHASDFFAVYHFLSSLAGFLGGSHLPEQHVKIKFFSTGGRVDKLLHPNVLASLNQFLVKPEIEPFGVWTFRNSKSDPTED